MVPIKKTQNQFAGHRSSLYLFDINKAVDIQTETRTFFFKLLQSIREQHAVARTSTRESGVLTTNVSPLSKQAPRSAAAARTQTNTLIIDRNQCAADRESMGWRLQRSGTTHNHKGSDLDLQRGRGAWLWKASETEVSTRMQIIGLTAARRLSSWRGGSTAVFDWQRLADRVLASLCREREITNCSVASCDGRQHVVSDVKEEGPSDSCRLNTFDHFSLVNVRLASTSLC